MNLLLVEDDESEALRLGEMLQAAAPSELEVHRVASIDDALQHLAGRAAHAVLIDFGLRGQPKGDGVATLHERFPQLPLIVLGGSESQTAALRAMHRGADDYLVRQHVNGPMLVRVIRYAIERERARAELHRERELLHTLLQHLPDRIYFKDAQSRFVRVSNEMARLFGLSDPAEAIGKCDYDFFDRAHADAALADERAVIASGNPLVGRVEFESLPDGRTYWVTTTKLPLRDHAGRIVGTFGVSRDITSMKRMEDALAEERNLLRGLINALPDQIYVKDLQGRFLLVNAAVQRFFSVGSEADLLGKSDFDLFPREVAEMFRAEEEGLLRLGHASMHRESQIRGRDGSSQWVLTTKVLLRDTHGRPMGTVGINRDITVRKQAEEEVKTALAEVRASHEQLQQTQLQLIEAEKLRSVGRLAAGIAHEVKNPLAIVSLGVDYLLSRGAAFFAGGTNRGDGGGGADADADISQLLRDMKEAIGRADQVIRGLLDFSSPRKLELVREDVNAVIERALLLVRHELTRAHVRVVKELAEGLPPVALDRNKIGQVFINAMTNAAHAMTERGGTLVLRTRSVPIREAGLAPLDGRLDLLPLTDRAVVAEIDDTGPGVPPQHLNSVFDPFFTTKSAGKGTGLGLTVSKAIVELHGGSIEMLNRPEGGARLRVMLRA